MYKRQHADAVKVLLAAGADAGLKNAQGCTPADQALAKGHADVASQLKRTNDPTPCSASAAPATAPAPASAPPRADDSLPEALGAMQLGAASPADDEAAALEAAMDAILDRLPESEADRVTDVLAGYEGTVRVEAMRKLIAQYDSQPPPASGANSAKGASAKGDCGGKGGQSERGQPERGKGRGRGEGGGAAIAVAALRSALPGGGASRPRTCLLYTSPSPRDS